MGYQVYQILLLFAIYSIAGWAVEQLLYGIRGQIVKRGLLRGPASPIYGTGAVLSVLMLDSIKDNLIYMFCAAILMCIILELIVLVFIKVIAGITFWKYYFIFPLVGSLFIVILLVHINPLVLKMIDSISMWVHFGFLIAFYILTISDFIDSVDLLIKYRKRLKQLINSRVDNLEYGVRICNFLNPYARWIKAYPHFKKETMSRILKGYKNEELDIIKKSARQYLS